MKATLAPMNGVSGELQSMASLACASTMRLAALAEWYASPKTVAEVERVLARDEIRGLPLRVLGGGSNLVFTRSVIPGLVLHTGQMRGIRYDGTRVTVGAGYLLPKLIGNTIARGLAGLEVLAGIPGTVGGAVAQNAGGRYGEIGDRVREVARLVRDDAGGWTLVRQRSFDFGYRSSAMKGSVIVEVTLELEPARDPGQLRREYREIIASKSRTQPLGKSSAGCIFKNPSPQLAAAKLIDEAGWKGRGVGAAVISPVHANFIVNRGGATPAQVTELVEQVREDIAARRGVELEREVEYW